MRGYFYGTIHNCSEEIPTSSDETFFLVGNTGGGSFYKAKKCLDCDAEIPSSSRVRCKSCSKKRLKKLKNMTKIEKEELFAFEKREKVLEWWNNSRL